MSEEQKTIEELKQQHADDYANMAWEQQLNDTFLNFYQSVIS